MRRQLPLPDMKTSDRPSQRAASQQGPRGSARESRLRRRRPAADAPGSAHRQARRRRRSAAQYWTLDDNTREIGRRGIAAARATLEAIQDRDAA